MGIKLSKRLATIASLVPEGSFLADVGSDHAYLPISLVQKGTIKYAQAIDNKMGPFLRMKSNVEGAKLNFNISCSLSSGLDDLKESVDCLALCGMGGSLTISILEKEPHKLDKINTIIVDAHTDLSQVRQKISQLGYHLEDEKMVYEDKIFYTIMKWSKGAPLEPYNLDQLMFGPVLMVNKGETYLEYLEAQRKKVSDILNKGLTKEKRDYYLDIYRRIAKQL
ncbi:MAG: class I SAM-dependent methyltransferase [Bacilli bacterium]|nr:class I SAM-dependent methyltransferase [Bacilli bacterium]